MLFSVMRSPPPKHDINPEGVLLWTAYNDGDGLRKVPSHVVCLSRAMPRPRRYALVCRSAQPIGVYDFRFDPAQCSTLTGRPLSTRQVTTLLLGDIDKDHDPGPYPSFRTTLENPRFVTLALPRLLTSRERKALDLPIAPEEWPTFAADLHAGRR